MKKWQKVQQTTEYFVDGIALVLATLITYLVFGKGLHRILLYTADEWKSYCFMMFVAYSAIAVGFASSIDLAKRQRIMELLAVLRNCSLTYMSFAVLLLVFKNPMIDSRYLFIGSYLLFILFSCLGRYVLKRVLTNNFSNSRNATLVGVVTTPDRAEQFVQSLQEDWTKRVDGVTILHADALAATASVGNPGAYRAMHSRTVEKRCCGVAVLPDLSSFLSWVRLSSIDEVYINFSGKEANWSTENLNAFIEELEDMGVLVHINIPTLEQFVEESKFNHMRCDIVAGYPMVGVSAAVQNSKMLGLKRFIDIIGAIVGLIVSAPIILLVAVPLLLESRGGLFFKQQRVGRNGRLFYMYKLRSMYANAEQRKKEFEEKNHMQGLMFKMDYDPRIIGSEKKDKNGNPKGIGNFIRKTSLDEFPQFWNVLKGDMSIVGNRPLPLYEAELLTSDAYIDRFMAPSGLTGLWQVEKRGGAGKMSAEERKQLDIKYAQEFCFRLDMKILLKTFTAFVQKENV